MNNLIFRCSLVILFLLTACGQPLPTLDQECEGPNCSETDINAPVPETPRDPASDPIEEEPIAEPEPIVEPEPIAQPPLPANPARGMPAFSTSWGLKKAVYDSAADYYERNERNIANKRYVTVIDFSQHSSKKRLYLFDLSLGTVTRYLTTHGINSDPKHTGYATSFSNVSGSKQSSLGAYLTLGTYSGSNGYSMRLSGKESTNSRAESRAIVVHPATYVSEKNSYAGRSWGCPALDPSVSKGIIDKIKGGSLLYIGR